MDKIKKVELVKAELFTDINFNMSCNDFINYARSKPNLLKLVKQVQRNNLK